MSCVAGRMERAHLFQYALHCEHVGGSDVHATCPVRRQPAAISRKICQAAARVALLWKVSVGCVRLVHQTSTLVRMAHGYLCTPTSDFCTAPNRVCREAQAAMQILRLIAQQRSPW